MMFFFALVNDGGGREGGGIRDVKKITRNLSTLMNAFIEGLTGPI